MCVQTDLSLVFRHVCTCMTKGGQRASDWRWRMERVSHWSLERAWIEEEGLALHTRLHFRLQNLVSALHRVWLLAEAGGTGEVLGHRLHLYVLH